MKLLTLLFCLIPSLLLGTPADTLFLHVHFPHSDKVPEVRILVKDTTLHFPVDGQGWVCFTLPKGDYELVIEGKKVRKTEKKLTPQDFDKDTLKIPVEPVWKVGGDEQLLFSQGAYGRYWQKGGLNNLAVVGRVNYKAHRNKGKGEWENELRMVYGFLKQGEYEFINHEDQFVLSSKFGYKLLEKLLFTTLMEFRTQFSQGYKINKDGTLGELNSNFLSPAYLNLSTGLDYKVKEQGFSLYYSPVSSKVTLVRDTTLSRRYLPKDHEDPDARIELGSYVNLAYQREILKNITLQTKGTLFANHLQLAEGVDLNWETLINFKVNKYLETSIRAQMIYDNDVLFDIKDAEGNPVLTDEGNPKKGPRTQFHEALNIGLVHRF